MLTVFEDEFSLPAKSIAIDKIIAQREALKETLTRVSRELINANAQAEASGFGSLFYACNSHLNGYYMPPLFKGDVQAILKTLDGKAWATLLAESGMRTFFNATQRKEWDCRLNAGDYPEFTRENIHETFGDIYRRRREIFEEGVVDVFMRLQPRHGKGFKSNEGMSFKKRFIVRGLIGWSGLAADSGCNDIDDLVRCFCVVSAQPEPDARNGFFAQVVEQLRENRRGFVIENEWLLLRVHPKAGTGHVTLKCTNHVNALNDVLARKLPLAIGKY